VNTAFDEFLAVVSELIDAAKRHSDALAAEAFYGGATSTAYYALFHRVIDYVANLVFGHLPVQRQISFKYFIGYGTFKGLRDELAEQYREADYAGFHDRQSILSGLIELCADLHRLQDSREIADFDPRIEDQRSTAEEVLRSSSEELQACKAMPKGLKYLFAKSFLWYFKLKQKAKNL
jgi:hypothetical protein